MDLIESNWNLVVQELSEWHLLMKEIQRDTVSDLVYAQVVKIYLDINGVVLKNDLTEAPNLLYFLEKALEHDIYWLTTHCRDGDINKPVRYLSNKVSSEVMDLLRAVKGTKWSTLKTEAIDFTEDFIWLEDIPMRAEVEKIKEMNVEGNLIIVDLKNNTYQLKEIADDIL